LGLNVPATGLLPSPKFPWQLAQLVRKVLPPFAISSGDDGGGGPPAAAYPDAQTNKTTKKPLTSISGSL